MDVSRQEAEAVIRREHYAHSFPSGWVRCYRIDEVWVVFSIPANKNLEGFLFSAPVGLRELARLWAPDGHGPNSLTCAIAKALRCLRRDAPECEAVVSFADPNQGHLGGVYRAASWLYTGQSAESRYYLGLDGAPVSRRRFHSGAHSKVPDLPVLRRPGKHRFVRLLTKRARQRFRGERLAECGA